MHHLIDAQVDEPNHNRQYDGSNHNDDCAVGQFLLGRPGNLVNEFVVGFLNIRKYLTLFHLSFFVLAREVRLELTTYGFGDRRSTN